MGKTKICCLDVSNEIIDYLSTDFDVYDGSLGKRINIPELGGIRLLLNNNFPDNLHEYDILIDEMQKEDCITYKEKENRREIILGDNSSYFISAYLQNMFDPIPFACRLLKEQCTKKKDKIPIKILFQKAKYNIEYKLINEIDNSSEEYQFSNYDHIKDCTKDVISGQKVTLCDNNFSKIFFEKFLDKITYSQTYFNPNKNKEETNEFSSSIFFIPLLKNSNGDIVSYAFKDENEITFMIPKIESKLELLKILFNEILYSNFSEYFPTITANSWTKQTIYGLPGNNEFLEKIEANKQSYIEQKQKLETDIEKNNLKYNFLHTLLTETGDPLVKAVIKFLKWLGFENAVEKDKTAENGLFEEDIQIDLGEKGLLIIEVKGINGTSKDAECSQIHKIKHRRCKERNKFDVFALYIVNNEKNIEPLKRTIPPFNEIQIKDAINDERGLLSTWQLFNLYFNIENGFITKEQARNYLLKFGLINFIPDLIDLGKPDKFYKSNTVVCLKINNLEIKVGDYLIYELDGRYYKEKIMEIQENKESKQMVYNGSFGFKLSNKIPNVKQLYFENKK